MSSEVDDTKPVNVKGFVEVSIIIGVIMYVLVASNMSVIRKAGVIFIVAVHVKTSFVSNILILSIVMEQILERIPRSAQ